MEALDTTQATCISCGYALRGLSNNRCPECGRAFDPSDPFSMRTQLWKQRVRLAYWLPTALFVTTWVTITVAPAFLPYPLLRWTRIFGGRLSVTVWIIASLVVAWKLRTWARRSILWPATEPHPRTERLGRRFIVLVGILTIVFAGGGIYGWSCPHGTSFRIGPLAVTHSTVGGPCNNHGYAVWKSQVMTDWYIWVID